MSANWFSYFPHITFSSLLDSVFSRYLRFYSSYLGHAWSTGEQTEIRYPPVGEKSDRWLSIHVTDFASFRDNICSLRDSAEAVYVGLNPRLAGGTKAKDVSRVTVVGIDLDPISRADDLRSEVRGLLFQSVPVLFDILVNELGLTDLAPMIVDTGWGLQVYFRVDVRESDLGGDWDAWTLRAKEFFRRLRTDSRFSGLATLDAVHDLPRIFRCPGSWNRKSDVAYPVRILAYPHEVVASEQLKSHILGLPMSSPDSGVVHSRSRRSGVTHVSFDGPVRLDLVNLILRGQHRVSDLAAGLLTHLYDSRSEAEAALISYLAQNNFSNSEIQYVLDKCQIGKWSSSGDSYKKHTISNVRRYLSGRGSVRGYYTYQLNDNLYFTRNDLSGFDFDLVLDCGSGSALHERLFSGPRSLWPLLYSSVRSLLSEHGYSNLPEFLQSQGVTAFGGAYASELVDAIYHGRGRGIGNAHDLTVSLGSGRLLPQAFSFAPDYFSPLPDRSSPYAVLQAAGHRPKLCIRMAGFFDLSKGSQSSLIDFVLMAQAYCLIVLKGSTSLLHGLAAKYPRLIDSGLVTLDGDLGSILVSLVDVPDHLLEFLRHCVAGTVSYSDLEVASGLSSSTVRGHCKKVRDLGLGVTEVIDGVHHLRLLPLAYSHLRFVDEFGSGSDAGVAPEQLSDIVGHGVGVDRGEVGYFGGQFLDSVVSYSRSVSCFSGGCIALLDDDIRGLDRANSWYHNVGSGSLYFRSVLGGDYNCWLTHLVSSCLSRGVFDEVLTEARLGSDLESLGDMVKVLFQYDIGWLGFDPDNHPSYEEFVNKLVDRGRRFVEVDYYLLKEELGFSDKVCTLAPGTSAYREYGHLSSDLAIRQKIYRDLVGALATFVELCRRVGVGLCHEVDVPDFKADRSRGCYRNQFLGFFSGMVPKLCGAGDFNWYRVMAELRGWKLSQAKELPIGNYDLVSASGSLNCDFVLVGKGVSELEDDIRAGLRSVSFRDGSGNNQLSIGLLSFGSMVKRDYCGYVSRGFDIGVPSSFFDRLVGVVPNVGDLHSFFTSQPRGRRLTKAGIQVGLNSISEHLCLGSTPTVRKAVRSLLFDGSSESDLRGHVGSSNYTHNRSALAGLLSVSDGQFVLRVLDLDFDVLDESDICVGSDSSDVHVLVIDRYRDYGVGVKPPP